MSAQVQTENTTRKAKGGKQMRNARMYAQSQRALEGAALQRHRHDLVETYGPLLKRVARRIFRRLPPGADGIEEEDLLSAGVLGLFEADLKFDPAAGYAFNSFAEFRIKGAMLDELRRRDFFPRRLRLKANKLRKAGEELERELGRESTDEELAAHMGIEVPELTKMRDECAPYRYVDSDDIATVLESATPNPFRITSYKQTQEKLTEALTQLPEREQFVLDMYFQREMTLREIAEMLDLTVGRISQIKTAAIGRLRGIMEGAA